MKTWVIASMILGILMIGGIALVNAVSDNSDNVATADREGTVICSSCGNGCTAENNCGLSTCGSVTGASSCGCGK